jgi:UDP:flavonoid glycosyltransferase YjiC (YdhE family)
LPQINTTKSTLNSIAYYITGHGYGHAVRASQVALKLQEMRPSVEIHIRTTAPEWLFHTPTSYSPAAFDVGMIQRDSLATDLPATLRACHKLHADAPQIIQREISFLRAHHVDLILGDIPPLCFEIADGAKIPSIAITNFTWNWIYRAYLNDFPGFLRLVEEMEAFYRKATFALILPFASQLDLFSQCKRIPWITRVSSLTKEQARAKFGLPPYATIVLLSFGGLGLNRFPFDRLTRLPEFFFVATGTRKQVGRNAVTVPDTQRRYEDLVRAVDVVVTKPGYGIVADAMAHQVPVLYTDRGDFPEYRLLVDALNKMTTAELIPQADLLSGELRHHLRRLLAKEPHWPPAQLNGAEVAAAEILAMLDRQT